jgi:hypothetical protein
VGDQIIYLIDTDVLVAIRKKKDSADTYSRLIKMARDGDLKTVRQVFDELETFGQFYQFLLKQKKHFLLSIDEQYSVKVQRQIEVVRKKANYLYEQTGSGDPADPWLVAASSHKFVLVTNEKQESQTRIPAACRITELRCRCISGFHFLYEVGIVKTINPKHVSTAAFFADPGY